MAARRRAAPTRRRSGSEGGRPQCGNAKIWRRVRIFVGINNNTGTAMNIVERRNSRRKDPNTNILEWISLWHRMVEELDFAALDKHKEKLPAGADEILTRLSVLRRGVEDATNHVSAGEILQILEADTHDAAVAGFVAESRALAYRQLAKMDDARREINRARTIWAGTAMFTSPRLLDCYEAEICISDGQRQEARKILIRLYEEYKEEQQEACLLRILMRLGAATEGQGDYVLALEYEREALGLARKYQRLWAEASLLNNIGLCNMRMHNYSQAAEYFLRSMALREQLGQRTYIAACHNNLGSLYDTLEQYPKAIEHFLQAIAIRREINDKVGEARSLLNLANVYNNLNDFSMAIEYINTAMPTLQERHLRKPLIDAYTYLGSAYYNLGDTPLAIELHSQALHLAEEIDNVRCICCVALDLGLDYIQVQRFDEAEPCLRRAMALALQLGMHKQLAGAQVGLARVLEHRDNLDEALQLLENALDIATTTNARLQIMSAAKVMCDIYSKKGTFEEAFRAAMLFNEHMTNMIENENRGRVRNLQVTAAIQKVEFEIRAVSAHRDELLHEVERKNNELTTKAMFVAQKNELLIGLRSALKGGLSGAEADLRSAVRSAVSSIDFGLQDDDAWLHFERQFREVNNGFLEMLAETYPDLTAGEVKMCALLRLNLSSKEIARVLNISLRAVETYRYRIRKKLNVGTSDNLTTFLLAVRPNVP